MLINPSDDLRDLSFSLNRHSNKSSHHSRNSQHRRPAIIEGKLAQSATYLIPESIRNRFKANGGWASHIPLTYLTDKFCSQKPNEFSRETLSFDAHSGQLLTSSKPLATNGELELSFDEWHQAWRRLLELIQAYCPNIYEAWDYHFCRIRDATSRAEHWPLWLHYDTELRRRSVYEGFDPRVHHIGLWNELEVRYNADRIAAKAKLQMSSVDSRNHRGLGPNRYHPYSRDRPSSQPTNTIPNQESQHSFRSHFRCIFCGENSHTAKYCPSTLMPNGKPCHLQKRFANDTTRRDKEGKIYCFSWNGKGCNQGNNHRCERGVHACTICGSTEHNAQGCNL